MRGTREKTDSLLMKTIRSLSFGVIAGAVFCALLLVICAFVVVSSEHLPQPLIQPIIVVISAAGAFLCGCVSARISKERGLLYGSFSALLLFLLLYLAGFTAVGEPMTPETLTRGLIMVIAGAIGGVLVVNRRSKKK